MKELKVTATSEVQKIEVRTGEAEKIHDFNPVLVKGTIETPLRFLENPSKNFTENISDSRIEVRESEGQIKLVVKENFHPTDTYIGAIEFTPEFLMFGINEGKSYTTFELANLIKMNRSFFETKDVAMRLVTELRNFKAKVDQDIERSDDMRGSATIKKIQAVESNIPESFKLNLPIFKGLPSQCFEVEIAIDATDLSCSLVSPDASDFQQTIKKTLIDDVIKNIEELYPELRIFKV